MNKYNEVDQALLTIITAKQPVVLSDILTNLALGSTVNNVYRMIDRRLTALKKKGEIRYSKVARGGPGWIRCGHE
jgi:hypothetical protein